LKLRAAAHQQPNRSQRMIQRNPLRQRHVTEHPTLLPVVSTHTTFLKQTQVHKKYRAWEFFPQPV